MPASAATAVLAGQADAHVRLAIATANLPRGRARWRDRCVARLRSFSLNPHPTPLVTPTLFVIPTPLVIPPKGGYPRG